VKLVVRYTPKVLEEMEMRFDKQRNVHPRVVELPKTEEGKPRPYDHKNSGRTPLATLKVVTN